MKYDTSFSNLHIAHDIEWHCRPCHKHHNSEKDHIDDHNCFGMMKFLNHLVKKEQTRVYRSEEQVEVCL